MPAGPYESPRISPDGKRLAFGSSDGPEANISIHDLDGVTTPRKLTFGSNNRSPIWSADGRYVLFQSDREGDLAVFRQLADMSGAYCRTADEASERRAHVPESWSRKDDLFLFSEISGGAVATLWSYSMRDRKATQVDDVRSSAPLNAELSPDGQWLAYTLRGGTALTTILSNRFQRRAQKRDTGESSDTTRRGVRTGERSSTFPERK